MKNLTPSYVMIQKYPLWEALQYDHPCVNNLEPVYIDKYDHNVKINSGPLLITSILLKQLLLRKLKEPDIKASKNKIETKEISTFNTLTVKNAPNQSNMETNTIHTQDEIQTLFNGSQLLKLPRYMNRSLIENLIPKREISVLAGKGDVGKSLFYLQMSLSIVLQKDKLLDRKIFSDFNSILIIATEDDADRISDRIHKQLPSLGYQDIETVANRDLIKDLYVRTVEENLLNFMDNFLCKTKVDLVILDALGDILKGDENNQQAVRAYYKDLNSLIRKHKCTFLLIAHETKGDSRKSNRNKIIGSTAIVDAARNVMMLSRSSIKHTRIITLVKSNNISDELKDKPIKMNFNSDTLSYSIANDYDVTVGINSETSLAAELSNKKESSASTQENKYSKNRKNKPGRKVDEDKVRQAFVYLDAGCSLEGIGDILNVHKSTIHRWLKGPRPKPID
jgi:hypothetical protein